MVPSLLKSHRYTNASPSGSLPAALKPTVSGAGPVVRSAAIWTVGAWLFAGLPTITSTSSVAVRPPGSRAVTFAT